MANYQLDFSGEQINNAIKYQSNYNYLLNPNFTINQKGITSYSGQCYSVDRWFLGDDLASATQSNDIWTFTISGASGASSRIIFEQVVENYSDFASLKVTATIRYSSLVESVSGTTELVIDDGVNTSSVDLDSTKDRVSVTHTVNASAAKLIYKIQTKATGTNVSIIPTWCKLEIGENSTDNIPRANGEELRLCQRYFVRLHAENQIGTFVSATTIMPTFTLPNAIREQPKINSYRFPLVYGYGHKYSTIQWGFKKFRDELISLTLKIGNNDAALNFEPYYFYCLKNGEIELDAEIYPTTTHKVTSKGPATSNIYYNYGKSVSSTNYLGIVPGYSGGTTSAISVSVDNVVKHISFYSSTPFTSSTTSGSISVSATSGTVSVTEGSNTCMLTLNNADSTITFTLN